MGARAGDSQAVMRCSARAGRELGRSAPLNSGLSNRLSWVATRSAIFRPCTTSAWLVIMSSVIGSTRRMLCSSAMRYAGGSYSMVPVAV